MTRHIWLLFLLLPLVNQLFAQCPSPYDHVVLYEISGDAGQSDGVDDGIVEIAGPPGTNIGCMVVSNSEWAIVIPENTMIPGDGVFLIACSMRMSSDRGVGIKGTKNGIACDECDFPCLPIDFDVCDPANIQYCDFAATGFTIDNQSSVDGDQVILFRPNGVPHDALYWGMSNTLTRGGATTGGASGDADHVTVQDPTKGSYTLGTGVVPMGRGDGMDADTSAVPIMPNGAGCMARAIAWTIPNLTDPIWVKHPSPTFVGCNSSYIRINGSTGQHGAPAHSPRAGSLIPFGSLTPSSCSPSGALAQWGYTDHPNPGLPNDTLAWRLTVSNDTFCSPSAVTFTLEVFNFQHVSDNVDLLSGACDENIGSYVMPPTTDPNFIPGPFNAQTWTTYSVDKAKGITTLTYTSGILPVGTHCFTLQWDDYSNCCGSTSKTSQNECYERELVCVTVFAPLSYDCNSDGIADPIQMMCEINCATNNPVPGIINATKYVTGGGNLCYTLVDSAGVLPPKTNSTGVFILEPNPTAGGYYIKIFDKSGCPFDTLFLKIFNNCEKAPICPTMLVNTGSSPSGFYCPNDSIKLCINGTNLPIGGIVEWFIGGSANFNVDTAKFICQTNLRQQDTIPKTCCPFLIGAYINACLGAAGQEGRNEFVAFRSGCDTLLASVINVGYGTTQIAAEGASDVYNGQNFSRTGYIDTLNSRAGCNIFFPL